MSVPSLRPADLADAGLHLRLPLTLELEDGAVTLERLLFLDPVGYWLAVGQQHSKTLLVKLWRYAVYPKSPWAIDEDALSKAAERGAPKLEKAFSCKALDLPLQVVAYKLERPTQSFTEAWAAADSLEKQRKLVVEILNLLALLHESGIEVTEFERSDYLEVQGEWTLVNGDRLRCMPRKTSVRDLPSLEAVAGLFAAIGHFNADKLQFLVGEYYRARGWAPNRANDAYKRAYLRQINRSKQRHMRQYSVSSERFRPFFHPKVEATVDSQYCSVGLAVVCDDLELAMRNGEARTAASADNCRRVNIDGEYFYLHRFSSAQQMHIAWRSYALLSLAGTANDRPIASIQPACGYSTGHSYLLTLEKCGDSLAKQLRQDPSMAVPAGVVELVERLVAHDLSHGMLSTGRIRCVDDGSYAFTRAHSVSDNNHSLRARQVADVHRFVSEWPARGRAKLIEALSQSKWVSPLMGAVNKRGVA